MVELNKDIFKYQEKVKLISQFQRFFIFFNGLLSLVLLLISNLTNGLRLRQFLVTKSVEANKSVKPDANGAH